MREPALGGVLVEKWRGSWAGKLQGTERKVAAFFIWVEMGWRGGSTCGRRAAAHMVAGGLARLMCVQGGAQLYLL